MVASSAFVLTALTMTGLYMKGQEARQQNDGYTLDFSALENQTEHTGDSVIPEQARQNATAGRVNQNLEDDLDYLPEEDFSAQAGSSLVEIPGLTDAVSNRQRENSQDNGEATPADGQEQADGASADEPVAETLHYSEEEGLVKPVNGEILLPYSMDGSIYFATLDQYKYNPATLFSAEEGSDVYACAQGRVVNVFDDAELGHAVTLDLGDGYTVTYGQLENICVEQGADVEAGERIASVAAPSRYYVQEGTNLYLCMKKDGKPINSEILF